MSDNYGFGAPGQGRPVPPHHPTVGPGHLTPGNGPDPFAGSGQPVLPHHPTVTAGYRLPDATPPPGFRAGYGPPLPYGPPTGPVPYGPTGPVSYGPPGGPPPYGPPPGRAPVRSGGPPALLVVGSVVLALLLGVGATLLYVQPWAQASSRVTQEGSGPVDAGPVTPQQGGTSPFTPESSTPAPDPGTDLARLASEDRAAVTAAVPEGSWVPQISSKKVGLVADGITYDDASILSNHQDLRSRYGAALLRSDDWATFKYPGFWVTIVPGQASSSPEAANAWCDAQGFPREECYAKRIGTGSYATTTKQR